MKKLGRMNGPSRQQALRNANNAFIRQLSSAVKLVRRRQVPNRVKVKLARHRKVLRAIANPRASLQSKRRVIVRQKGGFFHTLMPAILSVVASILRR